MPTSTIPPQLTDLERLALIHEKIDRDEMANVIDAIALLSSSVGTATGEMEDAKIASLISVLEPALVGVIEAAFREGYLAGCAASNFSDTVRVAWEASDSHQAEEDKKPLEG